MSKLLFNTFKPVSAKAWKQKIQVDLKGLDYNDTLIWKTYEGINIKPFYHSDDFKTLPNVSNTKATQWKIAEYFKVTNTKTANKKALEAIAAGTEHVLFSINPNHINLNDLLKDIDLNTIEIDLFFNTLSDDSIHHLNQTLTPNVTQTQTLNFHFDIINNLAKTGNWHYNLKKDYNLWEHFFKLTHSISIDLSLYQNAGANMVQQLAYSLAHANEYLNYINNQLAINKNDSKYFKNIELTFNVTIGSNYFFEIAKLRALRQLWTSLAEAYNTNTNCKIIAKPSKRNKTIYDYNVNMLRTTTECMSAVLGGANSVCNLPYDALYNKPNNFGNRISRNQLLILKHESYFDKVNNPADGSYYIETITKDLAEKALKVFKDIEAHGGFLSQLKNGTIQRKIKESATKEQDDFNTEKLVLLGTNKYINVNDKMKNNLEISPFLNINKRKTIIEPILQKRLSEKLEINRLKNE